MDEWAAAFSQRYCQLAWLILATHTHWQDAQNLRCVYGHSRRGDIWRPHATDFSDETQLFSQIKINGSRKVLISSNILRRKSQPSNIDCIIESCWDAVDLKQ